MRELEPAPSHNSESYINTQSPLPLRSFDSRRIINTHTIPMAHNKAHCHVYINSTYGRRLMSNSDSSHLHHPHNDNGSNLPLRMILASTSLFFLNQIHNTNNCLQFNHHAKLEA